MLNQVLLSTQVPNTHKRMRIKIMHNIGILFVKMGQGCSAMITFVGQSFRLRTVFCRVFVAFLSRLLANTSDCGKYFVAFLSRLSANPSDCGQYFVAFCRVFCHVCRPILPIADSILSRFVAFLSRFCHVCRPILPIANSI
jgi:hypothetical protein